MKNAVSDILRSRRGVTFAGWRCLAGAPVARFLAVMCFGVLTTASAAQTLNLGGSQAPDLGDNSIIRLLAIEMDEQIRAWQQRLVEAQAEDGDPERALVIESMLCARRLARRLLDNEHHGEESVRLLQALTLVNTLPAIDDLVQHHSNQSREAVILYSLDPQERSSRDNDVLRRWASSRARLQQFNEHVSSHIKSQPQSIAKLDEFMHDCFAPLCDVALTWQDAPCRSRWPSSVTSSLPEFDVLADRIASSDLSADAKELVLEFVRRLEAAMNSPAHVIQARELAILLYETVPQNVADNIAAGLDGELQAAPAEWVHSAVVRLIDPATRQQAAEELRAIARLSEMSLAIQQHDSRSGMDNRPVHDAIAQIIDLSQEQRTRRDAVRAVHTTDRIVQASIARRELPSLADAPRELKRTWRLLSRSFDEMESRTFEMLPELVEDLDQMAMPETVSLIANHREAASAMRRVLRAQQWIEDLRAQDSVASTAAAIRLGELLDQLDDEMTRAVALRELQRFEEQQDVFAELNGERQLRADEPRWRRATGDRSAEIVRIIDRDRRAWLAAWGAGQTAVPESQRLLLRWRLLALIEVSVICNDGSLTQRLSPWSAIELPSRAIDELAAELPSEMREAITLTLSGDDENAARAVSELERKTALLRTLAAIVLRLQLHAQNLECEDAAACGLSQLSIGPSSGAVMIGERDRLADLSRWMFEYQRARSGRNPFVREDILKYLNEQSQHILDVMDGAERWSVPVIR